MRKKALFFIAVLLGACGPDDTGGGNPYNDTQPGDGDSGDGDGDGDEAAERGGGEGPGGEGPGDPEESESDGEEQDPNAIVKVEYGPEGVSAVRVQGFAADNTILVDLLLDVVEIEFGWMTTLSAEVMGMQASWILFPSKQFEPYGEPLDYLLIHERAEALAEAIAADHDGPLAVCAMKITEGIADCTDAPDDLSCRIALEQAYCRCRGWLPEFDHVLCLDKV